MGGAFRFTFLFAVLFCSQVTANELPEMFRSSSSDSDVADTSIFEAQPKTSEDKNSNDSTPSGSQTASPLDDVVIDWLKQDKKAAIKKQNDKISELNWYCSDQSRLTLTIARPHCDEKKHYRGYTCGEQMEDYDERVKRADKLAKRQAPLLKKKRDLVCNNIDRNKPDPQIQAQLRALDAEIEAQERANRSASTASSKNNEQEAYARQQRKKQAVQQVIRQKKLARERKRQENERKNEILYRKAAEQYRRDGHRICGRDYRYAPEAYEQKLCAK